MRQRIYYDDDLTTVIKFQGDITSAFIYDDDGTYASGNAKHHPDDDYSPEFGERLAVARAQARYARKVERMLLKRTVR